jgi:hypothetical protein
MASAAWRNGGGQLANRLLPPFIGFYRLSKGWRMDTKAKAEIWCGSGAELGVWSCVASGHQGPIRLLIVSGYE